MAWPVYCGIGVVLAMLLVVWVTGFRVTAVLLALCFALVFIYLRHFGIWTKIMDWSTSLTQTAGYEEPQVEKEQQQEPTATAKYVSEPSSATPQRPKTKTRKATRRDHRQQQQQQDKEETKAGDENHRLMSVSSKNRRRQSKANNHRTSKVQVG